MPLGCHTIIARTRNSRADQLATFVLGRRSPLLPVFRGAAAHPPPAYYTGSVEPSAQTSAFDEDFFGLES